ncbi:hypothetical protein BU17DRAFT_81333 [Hysterangium stoloniferum]|nr:hypothetical protein BU17DRAFT_81333 [Hysterangium stoloniferum]
MAFVPPPNQVGIPLPQMPQNPAILNDIAHAHQYLDGRSGNVVQNPATDQEVGLAEVYKNALIFQCAPGSVGPPWLQAFQLQIQQNFQQIVHDIAGIRNDIALLRQEQPILLANSQAGTKGLLYNPVQNGWVLLAAPNPANRDELLTFTQHQCIASANALGLPSLPPHTLIIDRR